MELSLPNLDALSLDRPALLGVLNLTPDSFSDGGSYTDIDAAVTAAAWMVDDGADMIDIGGESTRPGAPRVDADEQSRRVLPILERLADHVDTPLSVDTTQRAVAEKALDAGAAMVNDVSAGRDDPQLLELVAERGTPIVLMHMLGEPATMQNDPQYGDVVTEVRDFLLERMDAAVAAGASPSQVVIDPGIGFGKTTEHNLALLQRLDTLVATGQPVMLGASRKRFIGQITGQDLAAQRAAGTAGTTAIGVMAGVQMFRVHDVAVNRQAADVAHAVRTGRADG